MAEWVEAMLDGFAKQGGQILKEAGGTAVKKRYPTAITQRVHSVEKVANLVVYACSTPASATNSAASCAEGGIVETIV